MSERVTQQQILLELGSGDCRLFRQNVGQAWAGRVIDRTPQRLVLADPRPLHAGLCKGSSDIIGWRSVVITPDMVGQRVATFVALEVKSQGGRLTSEQRNFLVAIDDHGGLAGIARSVEDARRVLFRGPL